MMAGARLDKGKIPDTYRRTASLYDAYDLEFADDSFDVLVNNSMFDLGGLVMVNMTAGERWYNGIWPVIYRINPALLGGCRGVSTVPHLEATGFTRVQREYVSQSTFPSEIILARAGKRPQTR
jgi:hypothetical protein